MEASGPALVLADLEATQALGRAVARQLHPGDAVLLDGPLGAGKTSLLRALLRELTGDDGLEVPSPTFTLVQAYDTRIGCVHHFDLWRLQDDSALEELGWIEARAGVVLIEWPDRLGRSRPDDALLISLSPDGDGRQAMLHGWAGRGLADVLAMADA